MRINRCHWRSYSVAVITSDFESENPGSNPGKSTFRIEIIYCEFHIFIFSPSYLSGEKGREQILCVDTDGGTDANVILSLMIMG